MEEYQGAVDVYDGGGKVGIEVEGGYIGELQTGFEVVRVSVQGPMGCDNGR